MVLTRKEGVRPENPLMTVGGYYPYAKVRTPALRKEADDLMKDSLTDKAQGIRSQFGLKITGAKKMPK